jgi:glycosyltransferase involved in cell wall biosynthesis
MAEQVRYPLRVTYDAQALVSKDGGMGKGVQLRNLLGSYKDTFVGLAPAGPTVPGHIFRSGSPRYLVWQQFSLPGLLRKYNAEVFLAPYNTAPVFLPGDVKLILVLHDLILLEKFKAKTFYGKFFNLYRRLITPRSVALARVILTVSQFSKNEILRRFPQALIRIVPCSISASWFVREDALRVEDRGDYLLLVTASAAHKNARRGLEAFARYALAVKEVCPCKLRVVGLSQALAEWSVVAQALGIEELVQFEPFLSEADLQWLYRRARAVMVPSTMEGFGIPVLEAMASGTPVISSNTASLPEVGGDAVRYFDPTDVEEMGNNLSEVLSNSRLRQEMIMKGREQAEKFHPVVVQQQVEEFWGEFAANFAETR